MRKFEIKTNCGIYVWLSGMWLLGVLTGLIISGW